MRLHNSPARCHWFENFCGVLCGWKHPEVEGLAPSIGLNPSHLLLLIAMSHWRNYVRSALRQTFPRRLNIPWDKQYLLLCSK